MSTHTWARAAAYVVLFDAEGRVLLTQFEKQGHAKSGYWTLPGGSMEWGEQASDTALRELHEETGLIAEIGPLLGVQSEWFEDFDADGVKARHALRQVFLAQNPSGDLKQDFTDDDTTVAASWFSQADLDQLDTVEVVEFGLSLAWAYRKQNPASVFP